MIFDTVMRGRCAKTSASRYTPHRTALLCLMALLAGAVGCARLQPFVDTSSTAAARQRVIDRIVDSTVKVIIERSGGRRLASASGVVIASRAAGPTTEATTYVLTAAHALPAGNHASICVGFSGSGAARGKLPATVVHRGDPDTMDLALLRVAGVAAPPPGLLDDDLLDVGRPILVVGFPEGERLRLSGGIVSQVSLTARENGIPADRPEHRIVIDAAAPQGVSGGGVFEVETGRLVGIVQGHQIVSVAVRDQTQSYTLKFPVPGATFVTPTAEIRRFLAGAEKADDPTALLSGSPPAVPELAK